MKIKGSDIGWRERWNPVDVSLEIIILANALILAVTFVFFGRSLLNLLKIKGPGFAFKFRKRYALALILTIVTVTGVYGATLFQHTFPAAPSGSSKVITSTCTALTLETTGMLTGFSASMLFNCGPTTAAITGNADGASTPTFTLPTGVASLSLVPHNSLGVCSGGSQLISGSAHLFSATDSLDYCLASTSYPSNGIASFTVTWSQ